MQKPQQKQFEQLPGAESEEVLELQQCEVEFLREQVQSLKQVLHDKNWQLRDVEEELWRTNEELCAALRSECLTMI